MQNVSLKDIKARPQQYWNIDGLPEIVMGSLWIIWGLASLIPDFLPKGHWIRVYWSIVPFILTISGFAAGWIIKRLKARWTFPRTGYVEWKKPKSKHHLASALLAIVVVTALGLGIAFLETAKYEDLVAAASGLLFAAVLLVAGWRCQLPHLVWLAAASLILGAALYPFSLGVQALQWILLGVGVLTTIAGVWRLTIFLKANPVEAA